MILEAMSSSTECRSQEITMLLHLSHKGRYGELLVGLGKPPVTNDILFLALKETSQDLLHWA